MVNSSSRTAALELTRLGAMWLAATAISAYPRRPIRIVVPLRAGTAPDLFARHPGQKLSISLKRPAIIENRQGATPVIGAAVAVAARARTL